MRDTAEYNKQSLKEAGATVAAAADVWIRRGGSSGGRWTRESRREEV
jgi:hypothetical protein